MADRNGDGFEDNIITDIDGDGVEDEAPVPPLASDYPNTEEGNRAWEEANDRYETDRAAYESARAAAEGQRSEWAGNLYNSERGPGGRERGAREAADAAERAGYTSEDGWNPFGERGGPEGGSGGGAGDAYGGFRAGGGGGSGGGGGGGGDSNEWNDWSSGIPVASWLTGQDQDEAIAGAASELARHEGYWGSLVGALPTEDELSVEYSLEGSVDEDRVGPGADSMVYRDALSEWTEGGFTDADRAMMDESRRRAGMTARASREADLSALEARGMGGSGASLAAMLSAGEGAADRTAASDATMMGAAQQRQLQATEALGRFGAREDDYLRDYAGRTAEYERGREGRNTDRDNRSRESAAAAAQQAHENRRDIVAGLDNQYGYTRPEDDDNDEGVAAVIGGAAEEVFG